MMRILLVFRLILSCVYRRTYPWRFFQLNSRYFNTVKGIFSKLDIDRYIPERWKLEQYPYDPYRLPKKYPVFIKPEWGQNSHGIVRVDSEEEYRRMAGRIQGRKTTFIVQEAACRRKEFEIFYIRSADRPEECALLSITEVVNTGGQPCPINSIHNPHSQYVDRTDQFSREEQERIWEYLAEIGEFRIARCGVRAESSAGLLAGDFHIIEINLFLPMPLYLCDRSIPFAEKYAFICQCMDLTADLITTLRREDLRHAVFLRKLLAHYRVKSWQF